ncbi:hypothetical protein A3A03_02640 [Candidatus Nomurabacteria bacterium RIFCSPLOWO2_01_FULL_40_18]|uniref:Uncharacterized protein n=1 Tax=Candidatus Nomurabacteria bacterium RIFCSPLOWO2_01_FULL_40_18 TaxID=1801773 RepID=A0A1F6XKY4_9BACT|nr:MAG: hypothetical protein A3A03_02640 [Candidatus Nomurabacteria bacterium RIFCSPLOWO2_01_FULL_40_18]
MNKNTYIALLIVVVLGIAFWAYNSSVKKEIPPSLGATVSIKSITDATSPASAVLAGAKNIEWQTANYPASTGVNINLIRKISDSPVKFNFVRALAVDTANDGRESWIPQTGENSDDLYVEVTCSTTYQFQAECSISSAPIKVK